MTRAGAAILLIASAALLCGAAHARPCRVPSQDPATPVPVQVWRDSAEFSFLIGRDIVEDIGTMTLARRLRPMAEFAQLRRDAANWGALRTRIHGVADLLAGLDQVAAGLQQFCDQLDAVSLDSAAPLDEASWSAGIARLEQRLDGAIATATPLLPDLQNHANLIRVAATRYAQGNYPANPMIRIGPSPEALARDFGEVAARWRALVADLQNARRILPVAPERQSERPLISITAAMREITRVSIEARALSLNRLNDDAFRHFDTGDYLYDRCPMIKEGQWVSLESDYWAPKNGGQAQLGGSGTILGMMMTEPRGGEAGVGYEASSGLWQFRKLGLGYWMIRNGASKPAHMALDIVKKSATTYFLAVSETNGEQARTSGQFWRCEATDRAGQVRLYNRHLSEERSVDTYPDEARAVMAETGYYAAQYWRVVPR